MQGIIAILLIVTATGGQSLTADYIGALPPVEVTAARYANEDIAWSGLLPAVEVTAPRSRDRNIAWANIIPAVMATIDASCCDNEDDRYDDEAHYVEAILVKQSRIPDFEMNTPVADLKIFGAIPGAVTFSGDYHLPSSENWP
jgi:hypothetical protein